MTNHQKRSVLTVRVSPALKRAIDLYAHDRGVSVNTAMVASITDTIRNHQASTKAFTSAKRVLARVLKVDRESN